MSATRDFFITFANRPGMEYIVEYDIIEPDPDCGISGGVGEYSVKELGGNVDITESLTEQEYYRVEERANELIEDYFYDDN